MMTLFFKKIFHGLLFLVLVISGLVYFIGQTTYGLHTTIQLISEFSPGTLHIQHAEGELLSEFLLTNISYHSPTQDITIQSLHFEWTWRELLHKKLLINQLNVHHLEVNANTADDDSNSNFDMQNLKILKKITIEQANIYNFNFSQNHKSIFKIQDLELKQDGKGNTTFLGKTLDGELQGKFNICWEPQLTWFFDLQGNSFNPKYPFHGNVNFEFQNNNFLVKHAEIIAEDAVLGLKGSLTDKWALQWDIRVPNFSTLIPGSKGKLVSTGTLNGPRLTPQIKANIDIDKLEIAQQQINKLNGKIDLTLKPDTLSSLQLTGYGIKAQDHVLKKIDLDITGQAHQDAKKISATFNVAIFKKHYLNILLDVPKPLDFDDYLKQHFSAKVNVDLPNLRSIKDMVPDVKDFSGAMKGALEFNGNLNNLTINGKIDLLNGIISLPKFGISATNINLHVSGNQTRFLTYAGDLRAGTGSAQLQGSTDFSKQGFPTTMTLKGNNLLAINLPEYKIFLSPDLNLNFSNQKLLIKGNIFVPGAKIMPKDFSSTVTLPEEVVFVGAKKSTANALLAITPALQVTVTLGDDVYVHYQDLDAVLTGHLVVNSKPDSTTNTVGEFYTTKGTYRAYGKVLTIQQGRLIYTGGALTNPGLNIKAGRKIQRVVLENTGSFSTTQAYGEPETLTVGVRVMGTMDSPVITLFSSPAGVSEANILSYLIMGVPQSQANGASLVSAISSMGMGDSTSASEFSDMTKTIQDKLGLTEMNVESVQTFNPNATSSTPNVVSATSLVLGKKLTDKLSIHYSISPINPTSSPISIWSLRYKINKHWSVQSETSTMDNGADLLYSIERK